MHRIDGPAAAPGGQFTEGDPNVGTPATVVTAAWANAVQEEVAAVIEATSAVLAKPNNHQLLDAIKTLIGAAIPPGAVQPFALSAAPSGWLVCDGSTFNNAAYPALAAALGATWGAAPSGQTRLPDLRGEFVRGLDLGRGVDAGRTLGSAQADELRSHSHAAKAGGFYGGDHIGSAGFEDGRGTPDWTAIDIPATGGVETRPRNLALLYCIKA